jgi:hypothetical protein
MASAHWQSFGWWSKKAARLGPIKSVVAVSAAGSGRGKVRQTPLLVGEDWRPLLVDVVTQMADATGLMINGCCTNVFLS